MIREDENGKSDSQQSNQSAANNQVTDSKDSILNPINHEIKKDSNSIESSNIIFDEKNTNTNITNSEKNVSTNENNNNQAIKEDDVCRVCRSEAEPERPLFYPCKCTGSIKYVHEDCLLQWLEASKTKTCELCKTDYNFAPIYAPNKPESLPFTLLIKASFRKLFGFFAMLLRFLFVGSIWMIFVPFATTTIWRFYMRTSKLFWLNLFELKWKPLFSDWLFGIGLSIMIVLLLLSLR